MGTVVMMIIMIIIIIIIIINVRKTSCKNAV